MTCADQPAPVVALDIGNVCVRLDLDACARVVGFRSMLRLTTRLPAVFGAYKRFETGATDEAGFRAEIDALLDTLPAGADPVEALCRMIAGPMPGMEAVAAAIVAAGHRLVLVSDITEPQYRRVRELLPFSDHVHGAVLSYEVGASKPDERMFAAVETRYCEGRRPLLYADDREELVAAACARGWDAWQFRDVAGLRRELERRGIAC